MGRAEEIAFVVPRVDCKAHAYGEVEKVAGSREPLVYACGGTKIPLTHLEGYVFSRNTNASGICIVIGVFGFLYGRRRALALRSFAMTLF